MARLQVTCRRYDQQRNGCLSGAPGNFSISRLERVSLRYKSVSLFLHVHGGYRYDGVVTVREPGILDIKKFVYSRRDNLRKGGRDKRPSSLRDSKQKTGSLAGAGRRHDVVIR